MAKYVCPVCGYVHEGNEPPEKCPQCGVPGSKFTLMQEGARNFVCEHVIGVGNALLSTIFLKLFSFSR